MPTHPSSFRAPWWLSNGHAQTILPVLLPERPKVPFQRSILELPDGDFLDLDTWSQGRPRLAVLSHGLEGNSDADYIHGMARALHDSGWDVVAWNYRGCGGQANRLLRSYHSGETADLRAVLQHVASDRDQVALVGFSLGGNITLKYLGEAPAHPAVVAGVAISAPLDLAASAHALDQRWANRLYLHRFLKTLIAKIDAKALRFPGQLDITRLAKIRSFQEFDDRFTAPLHGFRDANEYWTKCSSRQFLGGIRVPTLILNARNDPFLTAESFPFEIVKHLPLVTLEAPTSGGHVGFLDHLKAPMRWSERRVVEFLGEYLQSVKVILGTYNK